jgi:hypothetical protein
LARSQNRVVTENLPDWRFAVTLKFLPGLAALAVFAGMTLPRALGVPPTLPQPSQAVRCDLVADMTAVINRSVRHQS